MTRAGTRGLQKNYKWLSIRMIGRMKEIANFIKRGLFRFNKILQSKINADSIPETSSSSVSNGATELGVLHRDGMIFTATFNSTVAFND